MRVQPHIAQVEDTDVAQLARRACHSYRMGGFGKGSRRLAVDHVARAVDKRQALERWSRRTQLEPAFWGDAQEDVSEE